MSLSIRKMAAGFNLALLVSCSAWAQNAPAAGQANAQPANAQQSGQPQWVDRAEYDLATQAQNEADPGKKLDLLKQWKDKYPNSAFKDQRYNFMVVAYQQKGDAQGMYDTAKEWAASNPKGVGNYWLTILTTSIQKTDEGFLTTGEQAANGLIASLGDSSSPISQLPADQKTAFETAAHKTLGWVAMQRKNWPTAETEFKKVLQTTPNDAEVSYYLGNAILGERNTERTSEALYYLAHALGVTGQGALAAQSRPAAEQFVKKYYVAWHGSDEGYTKFLSDAKASANPPADFKILSKVDIEKGKVEAYNKALEANPSLAQWNGMKDLLNTPDGQAKFPTDIKGAEIPTKFTGKVVSAEPAAAPKRLMVSVGDATGATADATLNLSAALRCKVDPGTQVSFENAAPEAFTASPYMLTLNVDRSKISGLPANCTSGPAAPARRSPARGTTRRR